MSSILLDTHAFIWLSEDDTTLPSATREMIEATDDVFISIASFWEIAIKLSIGKIDLQTDFDNNQATPPQADGVWKQICSRILDSDCKPVVFAAERRGIYPY